MDEEKQVLKIVEKISEQLEGEKVGHILLALSFLQVQIAQTHDVELRSLQDGLAIHYEVLKNVDTTVTASINTHNPGSLGGTLVA